MNQDDVQLVWIQVWIVGQNAAGEVVTIPVASLERASAEKRVFRPDFSQRVARSN